MFKQFTLAATALAMGGAALVSATPAAAQRYDNYYQRGYDGRGYAQRSYDQRGYDRRSYDRRYSDDRYYDRSDYQRCRRDGTTGTILGAIAGGLLGHSVAGRGNRLGGALIGGGAGALAGRAIDRSGQPNYCR